MGRACWHDIRAVGKDGQDAKTVPVAAQRESLHDMAGSVDPMCIYRSPEHTTVSFQLLEPLAFPIDAATEFATYTGPHPTAVDGLGAATCLTGLQGTQYRPYNEVVVLLDGNRLFKVDGSNAEACETLKQLAQKAIGRI